jgi:stage V sporulation protein B
MAVGAVSVYELLIRLCARSVGVGRLGLGLSLSGAIIIAVIIYGLLVVATRTITRADIEILPKGKRIADLLKMK